MDEIFLRAYAKINLGLDVLRKREDGYHEVRMIMQNVKLFDKILLQKTGESGISMETNAGYLPVNSDNLMVRAAEMLFKEFELPGGLHMTLKKYIPVAAGLAGGSSDAAAVLYGVNRLYDLGLSLTELQERGVRIGADVPFCLMRGTALSEGIGEKLTRLPACPPCFVVLAKPPVSISTKVVYQALRADEIEDHPDIDGMIEALRERNLGGITDRMGNVLESVTIPMCPQIGKLKEMMLENGAMGSLMSGSGPTVFGIFNDIEKAKNAAFHIRKSRLASTVQIADMM